jgi:hypothetical protein
MIPGDSGKLEESLPHSTPLLKDLNGTEGNSGYQQVRQDWAQKNSHLVAKI